MYPMLLFSLGRAARDLDLFQARRDEKPIYGCLIHAMYPTRQFDDMM
jgi:hypothetical protein